jgi:DNA-binding SARP family transcriptional activator/ABC-type transport system substrate-binding protein
MEFQILGPLRLQQDGRSVPVRSGKLAELLAALLLRPNQVVSMDRLIDELWDGAPPATAVKTLQLYVSQLRRVVPPGTLLTQSPGYMLQVSSGSIDAERFEERLAAGRSAHGAGDPESAASTLREALSLWRGPALADFRYASFAQQSIKRLEELRLEGFEELFEAELTRGRHAEIVSEVEALVREYPLRERLRAQAMLALYRCGRQSEALDLYREGRGLLRDDLGIEPGRELSELEQAILRHDPALAAPRRTRTAPAVRRSGTGGRVRAGLAAVAVAGAAVVAAFLALDATGHRSGAVTDGVVRIDARSGDVVRRVELGTAPGPTVAGAGAIWTSSAVDNTISRVDPRTGKLQTIPVGFRPAGLAVGDNALWVANGESNTLERIDPATMHEAETAVGNAPAGVAIGWGSVWVANTADGTVTRVAESSGQPLRTIAVGPGPVALSADHASVWVTLSGAGQVARIDPRTNRVVIAVNVGNDPTALAAGRGAVWVANTDDGTVTRIDTANDSVAITEPVGPRPVALTEAAGSLWVALAGGQLERLDPSNLRVQKHIKLGSAPTALSTLGNSIWVTALPAASSHRGGTLRVDVASLDRCLCPDPAVAAPTSWELLSLVYDGLVAYRRVGSPAGNELVGDLAENVPAPTDGGRTYVFRLRPGLRFSTGAAVRPTDVRHSFERVLRLLARLDPGGLPPWRNYIVGADRCTATRCDLSHGIVADDRAATVTFRLRSPEPDFLNQLALPYSDVLPATTPFRVVARPPGATGEYEIASLRSRAAGPYEADGTMLLVRNPAFRDFSPDAHPGAFPDRIAVHVVPNPLRAAAAVEHARADIAVGYAHLLPEPTLEKLSLSHPAQLHADSLGATDYMFLNTRVPPFDKVLARRALNYAVDRGRLVQRLPEVSSVQPTCQLLPPGIPGFRPYCPYTSNPTPAGLWSGPNLARAKKLVAASGTRGMPVQVWTKANHAVPGAYFTALLRRLGYRASTRVVPENANYYGMISSNGAQIGWAGWQRDYSSAADFFLPTVSCSALRTKNYWSGNNFSRFCDPKIDRLINRALTQQTADPASANAAWAKVDRAVADEAPIVPYANEISETLVSRRVGNYLYNPQWGPLLDQLWVR